MTELEKMRRGEAFDYSDREIAELHARAFFLSTRINNGMSEETWDEMRALQRELLPHMDESAMVLTPFRCDLGFNIRIGKKVIVNYNCSFLDNAEISIGDHTLIGPDCHLLTSKHPVNYLERRNPVDHPQPIRIGDDCWLGGNVTVCPGVTIGNRVIVAAGAVVVHDIPDDVMVAGNPAVVKRNLKED